MAKKKQTEIVEVVAKCDKPAAVSEIENMIFSLRGTQVMLDSDLAMLYGIETRVLNQAVKRNLDRFPDDFMFRLTTNEYKNLKSQIVISSSQLLKSQIVTSSEINEVSNSDSGWGGTRKLPYAFTPFVRICHQNILNISICNAEQALHLTVSPYISSRLVTNPVELGITF